MNVEIGPEAVLFPEKEYINGIAVAVHTLIEALQRYNCQAEPVRNMAGPDGPFRPLLHITASHQVFYHWNIVESYKLCDQ